MSKEITLAQFINIYESGDIKILDVRESWEQPALTGNNIINIPINKLPQAIDLILKTEELIVICQHGVRSKAAIEFLENHHSFSNLINLQGGVSTYSNKAR